MSAVDRTTCFVRQNYIVCSEDKAIQYLRVSFNFVFACRGVVAQFGEHVARVMFAILIFNTGMFISATGN